MYASGLGIDRNITEAIKYFEKVLLNKSTLNTVRPETMYLLARILYKKNKILYRDRIIDLIKAAASQNYPDAQVMLGEGYLLGEDVEKNITKAKYWIKKAIDQNNSKAIGLWQKYEYELQ
jgi:TPR repeat protein